MSAKRVEPIQRMTVRDAIDELLGGGLFGRWNLSRLTGEQRIPINMFELPEGLMIVAPMPGLQPEDVELTVAGSVLTLRGRRTPGQEDRDYLVKEWDYGPYVRTLELPFPVDPDHMIATLDNGILTVNLRKSESVMPKRIPITKHGEHAGMTGGESHHSQQGMEPEVRE